MRPISGVTNAHDETKTNVSGKPDDHHETQDNYDQLALYEITNQRKAVKKKAMDYQEKLRIQKAQEEKKAQKKWFSHYNFYQIILFYKLLL